MLNNRDLKPADKSIIYRDLKPREQVHHLPRPQARESNAQQPRIRQTRESAATHSHAFTIIMALCETSPTTTMNGKQYF